ncbi:peptidyl-prolyl cis-trans isomerase [Desulfomarina profundi]|uniref:Peptidyl-prolyl cis-trans isomerase n=1 Tax=Desulfomarina profundi TaxID=2772557 RepID=A0A8D5G0B5_9BACT|nr:FKBP-type peptidyl-prolyl cis-trans isomerase [Desulfomarina profundi]BCL63227.1 peptidyl-prolyl cis-trans isomerase [Desulfomarina profundi]
MKTARPGSTVTIEFVIRLDDGSVVGEVGKKNTLKFTLGEGKLLKGLEENIIGMEKGESKNIVLSPQEGYGEYNKELVLRLERDKIPDDVELKVGRTIQYQNRDGERVNFVVNALDENTVTLDGNHPLAGLDLTYEVELVKFH